MMSEEMRSQQIEQKQIEEMVEIMCDDFGASFFAEKLYDAGYRKQSDVIDDFVERVKERLEEFTKQDYEDGVPYYHADCEQIDNVIDDVAAEMRQEVEK